MEGGKLPRVLELGCLSARREEDDDGAADTNDGLALLDRLKGVLEAASEASGGRNNAGYEEEKHQIPFITFTLNLRRDFWIYLIT
jgi:hypothetical protein